MESTNLHHDNHHHHHQVIQDHHHHHLDHHHHHHHHQVGVIEPSDSSSVQVQASHPCFNVGNNDHAVAWRASNLLMNNESNNIHASGGDEAPNPMVQELSFVNWPNTAINPSSTSHLIPNIKIKQESLPSNQHHNLHNYSSFQKFSDLLINPSSTNSSSPSDQMLLLKTLSPPSYKTHMFINNNNNPNTGINNHLQVSTFHPSLQFPNVDDNDNDHHHNSNNLPNLLGGDKGMITTFSQILPSLNISNLINNNNNSSNNMSSFALSSNSNTLEMNDLQGGSDLFASTRLLNGGSLSQTPPSSHLIELIKDSSTFEIDHDHKQQSSDLKLWNSTNNLSSFNNNGVQETKRSSCIVEPKSTTTKKPRFESRVSCPPLKVRKEKLGDRIAALQQLVAPFGKTDTASVLMEAIGYIKFLQNQVETLSVPYMKLSSRNKSTNNITQRVSDDQNIDEEKGSETKQDLRSRGLCLVPVSCMSYLASDVGNGGVWPPSNFNSTF